MKSEILGIEIDQIPLGYGCVAVVISGQDERPAPRVPAPPIGRRRDPATGHLWESHDCPSCRARRVAAYSL